MIRLVPSFFSYSPLLRRNISSDVIGKVSIENLWNMKKMYVWQSLNTWMFQSKNRTRLTIDVTFACRKGPSWSWSYGMVVGFTTNGVIIGYHTKVVSSNPVHGEMYSIQYYLIKLKFVSDLRQACGYLWVLRFSPPIKLTGTI
jgi:hypothetical protein